MQIRLLSSLLLVLAVVCTGASRAAEKKSYTFGMIGKSQGNQFFEAARSGANAAARELGAKHGITIKIDWRTPNEEDAQKQAEYVEQMVLGGVDGALVLRHYGTGGAAGTGSPWLEIGLGGMAALG